MLIFIKISLLHFKCIKFIFQTISALIRIYEIVLICDANRQVLFKIYVYVHKRP